MPSDVKTCVPSRMSRLFPLRLARIGRNMEGHILIFLYYIFYYGVYHVVSIVIRSYSTLIRFLNDFVIFLCSMISGVSGHSLYRR